MSDLNEIRALLEETNKLAKENRQALKTIRRRTSPSYGGKIIMLVLIAGAGYFLYLRLPTIISDTLNSNLVENAIRNVASEASSGIIDNITNIIR